MPHKNLIITIISIIAVVAIAIATFFYFQVDSGKDSLPLTTSTTQGTPETTNVSEFLGAYTLNNADYGTEVTVTIEDGMRTIVANGLPNHGTGAFPNNSNPNSISEQSHAYKMTTTPTKNNAPTNYSLPDAFGVALNGVPFDPYAAEWYDRDPQSGWQEVAVGNLLGLDNNNAHVQPNGTYHYHGEPTGLIQEDKAMQLLGFAADGFPIYSDHGYKDPNTTEGELIHIASSYKIKEGIRPSGPGEEYDGTYEEDYEYVERLGDLDQCNSRTGVTPEYPQGITYYVITEDYPLIPRCFWGTPDDSFAKGPGGNPGGPPERRPEGPPTLR